MGWIYEQGGRRKAEVVGTLDVLEEVGSLIAVCNAGIHASTNVLVGCLVSRLTEQAVLDGERC